MRRELTLVSKILQVLANQLPPSAYAKEKYMLQFKDFIQENIPKLNKFYEEVLVYK